MNTSHAPVLTAYPGLQIGWRTTYVVEYLGPLLIHPLLFFYRAECYTAFGYSRIAKASRLQQLALLLICVHFSKRIIETVFVHRFSASTMPLRNIFKNCLHYWGFGGILLAYFIYSPTASIATRTLDPTTSIGLAFFVLGELGNLNAHLVLRGLRTSGGRERGIPQGAGFSIVTCPNYMFESLAWIGFSMVSMSWMSLVFTAGGVGQMALWAKKREANYRKEFGERYKPKRYVILPGIY